MRNLPTIRQLWEESEGKFLGDKKPQGRVTVEPAWQLSTTGQVYGSSDKGPYRWFYREDQAQSETEVPNIKSISINRSIDKDAADCTIVMYNQFHETAASVDPAAPLGNVGYYGYNYGNSPEAFLFSQTPNSWSNILIPNALLRTYQGFGGWEVVGDNFQAKALATAISEGNIAITGTWLIDRVNLGTNGLITLTCRDMAKLLLDQSIFVPLVPDRYYPVKYQRWVEENVPTESNAGNTTAPSASPNVVGTAQLAHSDSSTRRWSGDGNVQGTSDTNVWDGSENSYSISSGASHWNNTWAKDWWEATVAGGTGASVNSIYVSAYGGAESSLPYVDGGYWTYISIMEDGIWQKGRSINPGTNNIIPWDDANSDGKSDTLVASMGAGNVPATDTDINYILFGSVQNGSAANHGEWFDLDRVYQAERIRITLIPMWKSPWGPNFYRSGLRQVKTRLVNADPVGSPSGPTPSAPGGFVTRADALAIIHDFAGSPSGSPDSGFIDVTAFRHIEAVNWAKEFGITTGTSPTTFTPDRAITRAEFVVFLFRAADSPAGAPPHPFADIQQAWQDDAVDWAYTTEVTIGTSANTFDPDTPVIPAHLTLFITRYGPAVTVIPSFWDIPVIEQPGPIDTPDPIFHDGNMKDWLDPVEDLLLWSGFLFYETSPIAGASVHGILEAAGSAPTDVLGEDVFDKKTVIDAITTIKEVLGYIFHIDEQGGVRFHSPNWIEPGNMNEIGGRDPYVPELLDTKTLTDYSSVYSDELVRSEIVLGNIPIDEEQYDTDGAHNVHVDPTALFSQDLLRGMTKPAIWVNEIFTEPDEQKLMAALIGLHLMFQSKTGSVTALANPEIQLDDQVRITERISSESYLHYVRGIRTTMDLDSGSYLMTLTTNWLGESDDWAYNKQALLDLYTAARIESAGPGGNESPINNENNVAGRVKGGGGPDAGTSDTGLTNDIPGVDPGTDQAGP